MSPTMTSITSKRPYHASKKVGSTTIVTVRILSVHCPRALVERIFNMCVPASMSRKSMLFIAVG